MPSRGNADLKESQSAWSSPKKDPHGYSRILTFMTARWRMSDKIVLFNAKYSPNLGDGIIALCLEHELRRHFNAWEVHSIDLAGRAEWLPPSAHARKRALALTLLSQLPSWAEEMAVRTVLNIQLNRHLMKLYADGAEGSRFAVIGGGQLFQDGDLNFPLKISAAAKACGAAGVPIAVYGVGASASYSRFGRVKFKRVLRSCSTGLVFARDEGSAAQLRYLGAPSAETYLDPGLLAAELWPAARSSRGYATIGLCITHPAVLRHHSEENASRKALLERLVALIARLTEEGYRVVCFTNGAGEDELYLAQCRQSLAGQRISDAQVKFAERCRSPDELARLVASFDLVIAHRLHACVLAYSYRTPAIGLRWDPKVQAFFNAVGQPGEVLDLMQVSNDLVVARV